ncbi:MAG: polysaccharide biosynthesis protein [Deltaproteobacteria bacterium]|nr:polysaccharide biosynthesis protein [Deltaproteobacteria bacterium]
MKNQLKNPHFYLMLLGDACLFAVALTFAYLFRFEFSLDDFYVQQLKRMLILILPLKLCTFFLFDLYKGMWRYTSTRDFWRLLQASATSTLIILAFIFVFYRFAGGYSRAIFVMDGGLSFLLTGGLRMVIRTLYLRKDRNGQTVFIPTAQRKRILIIGAGSAGEKILREIIENDHLPYLVIGFIDDDRKKYGRSIHGIPVLGSLNGLAKIVEDEQIKEILIAIPSATGDQIRRIVETCKVCQIAYKTLPGMGEIIDGRVSLKALRDVNYEDLLGRSPVQLDMEEIQGYLDNKTILVTGCGGSIGAELCRQIVRFQPKNLILLDASESNLFHIELELCNKLRYDRYKAILGHVQDEKLMTSVFEKYRPQVVFHAAAYKHVPMLEKNPWEAVFNNITGSRVLMGMALKHRAERFVLVSTDKAVRPTNVMGASKRVTELLLQTFQNGGTRFMAVRFGNVVGSSGSVIPVFRNQIEQGGPVTVTHPEVRRFFMTIPEAAQLILQAGALGQGGEIFILKMGTPVKIIDMARDLIRLSGREPDKDVKIAFIGLRDGEKLCEELITVGEGIVPTKHEKIMVLRNDGQTGASPALQEWSALLDARLRELNEAAARFDAPAIRRKLQEIVPEYTPSPPATEIL